MTEEMKAKRRHLAELSNVVKMAVKEGMYESVNEGLVDMYAQDGHTEIHSFKGWLSKGMVVKRGEKALLLWGEPRKTGKQEKPETPGNTEDEYKFFPLAYVFSQKQVQKLNAEK